MTASNPEPKTQPDLAALLGSHLDVLVENPIDEHTVISVDRSNLMEVLRAFRDKPELDCDLLVDICGADYPEREKRFEVVYHLASLKHGHRFRIKVPLDEKTASVPTSYPIWKGADWFEREAFDMFGIVFEGHSDLSRILCPDDWEGYPLRKDYEFPKSYQGLPV